MMIPTQIRMDFQTQFRVALRRLSQRPRSQVPTSPTRPSAAIVDAERLLAGTLSEETADGAAAVTVRETVDGGVDVVEAVEVLIQGVATKVRTRPKSIARGYLDRCRRHLRLSPARQGSTLRAAHILVLVKA